MEKIAKSTMLRNVGVCVNNPTAVSANPAIAAIIKQRANIRDRGILARPPHPRDLASV